MSDLYLKLVLLFIEMKLRQAFFSALAYTKKESFLFLLLGYIVRYRCATVLHFGGPGCM